MTTRALAGLFAALSVIGCRTANVNPTAWVQLEQWDTNRNDVLEGEEFKSGYLRDAFDLPWTGEQKTTTCSRLSKKIFTRLDFNADSVLEDQELTRRQVGYLTGTTYRAWKGWDDNGDNRIAEGEFTLHAINEHLCGVFDPNSDGVISSDDLAAANFVICDQDKNGTVGGMEFYLWEIQQRRQ